MKTTLVIPATNGNFNYLRCILSHYQDGSVKPDQVIISLSNAHLVSNIEDLEQRFRGVFEDFKILKHNQTMVQGPNRDAASMAADNEIIISNDADDIPHPQRIEVIKHCFETLDILHLNHSYKTTEQTFDPIDLKEIKHLTPEQVFNHHFPKYNGEEYEGRRPQSQQYGFLSCYGAWMPWGGGEASTMAGAPAFHRDVFKTLRWRQQEELAWDYDFCLDVVFNLKKSTIIDSKLMWYNLLPVHIRRENANPTELGVLYKN